MDRPLLPAGDVEDDTLAGDVVLDADIEVAAAGVEDAPGPLSSEVVEGGDADAAVALEVGVGAVGQAVPQVVVVGALEVGDCLGVLVEDPVAPVGLVGDVVGHGQGRAAGNEQLDLGGGGVGAGCGQGAVADADGLAPELVVGFVAGVVGAEPHPALGLGGLVDVGVLGPVVAGQVQGGRGGAQVGVGRGPDRDPGSQAVLGALAVVGATLTQAQLQPKDGAGGGVGGVGQRADRAGAGVAEGGGDELEVGPAGHALGGSVLVAVVGDAVGVDGQALERQPSQGGAGG